MNGQEIIKWLNKIMDNGLYNNYDTDSAQTQKIIALKHAMLTIGVEKDD